MLVNFGLWHFKAQNLLYFIAKVFVTWLVGCAAPHI